MGLVILNMAVTTMTFWFWWIFTEAQDRRYRNRMWQEYWKYWKGKGKP